MGFDPSKLTRAQRKSALIGTLLGDGNLLRQRSPGGSLSHAQIRFTHSLKQLEYLEMKRAILQPMFEYEIPIRHTQVVTNGKTFPVITMQTRVNPQLTQLHRLLYDPITGRKRILNEALERLDDLGVALWYLDDGNYAPDSREGRGGGQVRLYTMGFTEAETLMAQRWFADRYDIQFNVAHQANGWYLRRGISDARKLLDVAAAFAPPSMRYKVEYRPAKHGWYTLRNTVPATPSPV